MAKQKKKTEGAYTVTTGCDTADGKRYEIRDTYDPADHQESVTKALLEMGAIEREPLSDSVIEE